MTKREKYNDYCRGYFGKKVGFRTPADFRRLQSWYFGWLKFIEQKINLSQFKNKKVIDIGGGFGAFATLLQKQGFKDVTCNDISSKALRLAKKYNPQLNIACFDVEKMEVENEYNLIFALEVLEHLEKPKPTIEKIYKSLKKNGLFIGSTPYPFPKGFVDPTHQHVLPPEEWREYFEKAGFAQVASYPMSFSPLIYRLSKHLNFCFPFYIKNKYFVSTTLIIARKNDKK